MALSIKEYKQMLANNQIKWDTDALSGTGKAVSDYLSGVEAQSRFEGQKWSRDEFEKQRGQIGDLRGRLRYMQAYANSLKGKDEKRYGEMLDSCRTLSDGLDQAEQWFRDNREGFLRHKQWQAVEETKRAAQLEPMVQEIDAAEKQIDAQNAALYGNGMTGLWGDQAKAPAGLAANAKDKARKTIAEKYGITVEELNSRYARYQKDRQAQQQAVEETKQAAKMNDALAKLRTAGMTHVAEVAAETGVDKKALTDNYKAVRAKEKQEERDSKYGGMGFDELVQTLKSPDSLGQRIYNEIQEEYGTYFKDYGDFDKNAVFKSRGEKYGLTGEQVREIYDRMHNANDKHYESAALGDTDKEFVVSRILQTGTVEQLEELQKTLPVAKHYDSLRYQLRQAIEDKKEQRYYLDIAAHDPDAARAIEGIAAIDKELPSYTALTGEKAPNHAANPINSAFPSPSNASGSLMRLQEERAAYVHELKTKGYDVDNALKYYKRYDERRQNEQTQAAVKDWTSQNGFNAAIASIASVPINMFGSMGDALKFALGNLVNWGDDGWYDPKGTANYTAQNIRSTTSEMIDNATKDSGAWNYWAKQLYNTGMSAGDMVLAAAVNAVPVIGQAASNAMFFSSAGVNAANEVIENGGSLGQATLAMVASGSAELLFERVSLDKLEALATSGNVANAKEFFKDIVKQAFVEGSEEFNTTLANTFADALINGGNNSIERSKRSYMAQGMSEQEAESAAIKDWTQGVVDDTVGGALSGLLLGGAAGTKNALATNRIENVAGLAMTVNEWADLTGSDSGKAQEVAESIISENGNDKKEAIDKVLKTIEKNTDGQTRQTAKHFAELNEQGKLQEADAAALLVRAAKEQVTVNGIDAAARTLGVETLSDFREKQGKEAQLYAGFDLAGNKTGSESTGAASSSFGAAHPNGMIAHDLHGKTVTVLGVESSLPEYGGDGSHTVTLRLSDGSFADAAGIDLGDTAYERLLQLAPNYDTLGARALLANFDSAQAAGMPIDDYIGAFQALYAQGARGVTFESAQQHPQMQAVIRNMGEQAARAAMEAGTRDGDILSQSQGYIRKRVRVKGKALQESGVSLERGVQLELSEDARTFLDMVAAKTGKHIVLTNALSDEDRGIYSDNTIYLNANKEEHVMMVTALHEAVHNMKEYAPEDYRTLEKFVFNYLAAQGKDIRKMLDSIAAVYGKDAATEQTREEELVCKTVEGLAADRDALATALGVKENIPLKEKIGDILKRIADRVMAFFKGDKALQQAAHNRYAHVFLEDVQALRDMADIVSRGFDNARETEREYGKAQSAERFAKVDIDSGNTNELTGPKSKDDTIKDTDYLSAVERGDMETAQRMVDEAARAAGYTTKTYHGTPKQFNSFEATGAHTKAASASLAIWFSDSTKTARAYATPQESDYDSHNKKDWDSICAEADKINQKHKTNGMFGSNTVAFQNDYWNLAYIGSMFREYLPEEYNELLERGVFKVNDKYIDIPQNKNALSFDQEALKKHRDVFNDVTKRTRALQEWYCNLFEVRMYGFNIADGIKNMLDMGVVRKLANGEVSPRIMQVYINTNNFAHAQPYVKRDEDKVSRIRSAKRRGKDGIIFPKVNDGGERSTHYAVFDSTLIKSADPVTYDDNGKVIPLSKRFDKSNPDIRYSKDDTIIDDGDDGQLIFTEDGDISFDVPGKESVIDVERLMQEQGADQAIYTLFNATVRTAEKAIKGYRGVKMDDKSYAAIAKKVMRRFDISEKHAPGIETVIADRIRAYTEAVTQGKRADFSTFINGLATDCKRYLEHSGRYTRGAYEEDAKKLYAILRGATILISPYDESAVLDDYDGNIRRLRDCFKGYVHVGFERERYRYKKPIHIRDVVESFAAETGGNERSPYFPEGADGTAMDGWEAWNWLGNMLEMFKPQFVNSYTGGAFYQSIDAAAVDMALDINAAIADEKAVQAAAMRQADRQAVKEIAEDRRQTLERQRALHKAQQLAMEQKYARLKQRYEREHGLREMAEQDRDVLKRFTASDTRNFREQYLERQRARNDLESVRRNIAKLRTMIVNPTNEKFIPPEILHNKVFLNAVEALGEGIISNRRTAIAEKMQDMLREIKAVKGESKKYDGDFENAFDAEFTEELQGLVDWLVMDYHTTDENGVRKITREGLDNYEIARLRQMVDEIVYRIENARKLLLRKDGMLAREASDAVIRETRAMDKSRAKKIWAGVSEQMLNPLRTVNHMSGFNEKSELHKLFYALNEGQRKSLFWQMNAEKEFAALVEKNEDAYKASCTEILHFDYTADGKGYQIDMTRMQALQALMTWKRESRSSMNHMRRGGIKVADPKAVSKGKGNMWENARTVPVSHELIDRMIKSMGAFENAYMRIAEHYFNHTAKDAINETFMVTRHREIAKSEYYIPVRVDDDMTKAESTSIKYDFRLESAGSYRRVTPGAPQPILIESLNSVIDRHIAQTGRLYGLDIPLLNFRRMFKGTTSMPGEGNFFVADSVKKALGDVFGKDSVRFLEDTVNELEKGGRESDRDKFSAVADFLYKTRVKTSLVGNLGVVIKQAASYPTAGLYLSMNDLNKGLAKFAGKAFGKHYKDVIAEIDRHTAQHYIRRKGMSVQEVADMMQQSKLSRKTPAALNPVKWIQGMDCLTTAALWEATKSHIDRQYKKAGKEKGSEEYWQDVTNLYDTVIEDTQPMYDALHRSEFQKNKSSVRKFLFPFKTQPMQNMGILADAAAEMMTKRDAASRKKFAKAVASQISSNIVFSLMTFAAAMSRHRADRYKDDEDKYTFSSVASGVMWDVFTNGINTLLPIGGDWLESLGEDIVTNISKGKAPFDSFGKLSETTQLSILNDWSDKFSRAAKLLNHQLTGLEKKEINPWDFTWRVLDVPGSFAEIFGIPYSNLSTLFKGVGNWVKDFNMYGLVNNKGDLKTDHITDHILKAYDSGNRKKGDELTRMWLAQKINDGIAEDNATENINEKLAEALKVRDDLKRAYAAKNSGDLKTYKAVKDKYLGMGLSETVFDKTIHKIENAAKKEEKQQTGSEGTAKKREYTYQNAFDALQSGDTESYAIAKEAIAETMVQNGKAKDEKEAGDKVDKELRSLKYTKALFEAEDKAYHNDDGDGLRRVQKSLLLVYGDRTALNEARKRFKKSKQKKSG